MLIQGLEIFFYRKELWFSYLLCGKYFGYANYLSKVISSSSTVSDNLMVFPSKDMLFSMSFVL